MLGPIVQFDHDEPNEYFIPKDNEPDHVNNNDDPKVPKRLTEWANFTAPTKTNVTLDAAPSIVHEQTIS